MYNVGCVNTTIGIALGYLFLYLILMYLLTFGVWVNTFENRITVRMKRSVQYYLDNLWDV